MLLKPGDEVTLTDPALAARVARAAEALAAARSDDPAVSADLRQQAGRLLQLLADLPEAQREAFLLQQESDMSIEEIAQATGVNRETAKSRLRYAMARLRAGMKDAG